MFAVKKIVCLLICLFINNTATLAAEADTRTQIRLSPQHQALVSAEMQQFLAGLQQISDALAREDMTAVARVARSLGTSMSQHMPAELKQALPPGFRKHGHAVHSSFDQLALDAESLGDVSHSLSQLSETLSGCAGCHGVYRIQVE